MFDLAIPGLAYAEANWGRWIVRCPRPFCTNAIQVNRWEQAFTCAGAGGCGWSSPIEWPPDPEGIEALLSMRPDATTRNWLPGETLQQLLIENSTHDVVPREFLAESGCILETRGERITDGRLMHALPEYRRREIGVS